MPLSFHFQLNVARFSSRDASSSAKKSKKNLKLNIEERRKKSKMLVKVHFPKIYAEDYGHIAVKFEL